jgi:hypothetical protein
MKKILLFLLLICSLQTHSQIPNNESFSFCDVATYFGWTCSSGFNLSRAFEDATESSFDSRYYPYYLVAGTNYQATNSLLNFRNYGGVEDGVPIPTTTGATDVERSHAILNWSSSLPLYGGVTYLLDVSTDPNFGSFVWGNHDYDTQGEIAAEIFYLTEGTTYYYRVRTSSPNGISGYSNVSTFRTASDWFLPSHGELAAMFNSLIPLGLGSFSINSAYWSSTQSSFDTYANAIVPINSGSYYTWSAQPKSNTYRVRAARTFISSWDYDIGDYGSLGLIFYVVSNGDGSYTYYECYTSDQSTSQVWSNITSVVSGATSQNIGMGAIHTVLIISQSGHTSSAAKLCDDL